MDKIVAMRSSEKSDDFLTYAKINVVSEKCAYDPGHFALEKWQRPLKVIGSVRPFTDFEWTVYGDLIVTNEVQKKLAKTHFTGFRFQPVDFFSTTKTPFGRDSVELEIIGWGGRARKESGVEIIEECPACKRRVFAAYDDPGKIFNADEWDGSDLFTIWPMPRTYFVSKDVRNWIADNEFTGVRFIEISKLPPTAGHTLTPRSLESLFDAEIAKRIKDRDPDWWYGNNQKR